MEEVIGLFGPINLLPLVDSSLLKREKAPALAGAKDGGTNIQ